MRMGKLNTTGKSLSLYITVLDYQKILDCRFYNRITFISVVSDWYLIGIGLVLY